VTVGRKKVICVGCGDLIDMSTFKRYIMRSGKLLQVCRVCYNGPQVLNNPFRELGFPEAGGGKIAPGNYQWRSKNGPGS